MAIQKTVALMFLYLAVVYQESHGMGVLTLRLLNYSNPTHQLANGKCCENPPEKRQHMMCPCFFNCSNTFEICVTPIESNISCSLGRKRLGWRRPRAVGDEFRFPPGDGYGTADPLQFPFNMWNEGVVVNITIVDERWKPRNFVAHYSYKYARPTWNTPINLRGKFTSLDIMLNVYCDKNYVGPKCSKYCKARDDDQGHFECDYCKGENKCLAGWYDPDTSCTRKKEIGCFARNDPRGYYQCDPVSGKKICLPGWEGEKCNSFGMFVDVGGHACIF